MSQEYPFIRATKPDETQYVIDFESIINPQSKEIYIYIGRQDNNDIVLSDPHKKISRHHCSIQYKNNRWWIVDEGSSNGTFLQREIEQPATAVRGLGRLVEQIKLLLEVETIS